MRVSDITTYLQEPPNGEGSLFSHWEESIASFPTQGIPFLAPEMIHASLPWAGLPSDAEIVLQAVAEKVRNDPILRTLAWHCEQQVFEYPEGIKGNEWPSLDSVLGDSSGTFYLLIGLSVVPRIRARHAAMGVPDRVTRSTCRVAESFYTYYRKAHRSRVGMFRYQLYWLRRHAQGLLFRIGRLEYYLTKFHDYEGGCEVYRNHRTGEVIALALDGQEMNETGWRFSDLDDNESDSRWTTSLVRADSSVCGNPISPCGSAVPRQVTLPLAEWDHVLSGDDTVLSMHIPAGDQFTPEMFVTSMRDAIEFFRRHFPDQPSTAVACWSWIFNPALETILPDTSNLVNNMREVYLWPIPKNGLYDGLWFIFVQPGRGGYNFDPDTAEAHTGLERAVLDYVRSGKDWRCGAMFFLNQDLEHFGSQYYRSHWREETAE